jgi:hypothetical protein
VLEDLEQCQNLLNFYVKLIQIDVTKILPIIVENGA